MTVFAAEAPRAIRDQLSRNARSLGATMGLSLESIAHVKLHGMDQALLVVSPEHARTFERDGYGKDDLRARIPGGHRPAAARSASERRVPEGHGPAGAAEGLGSTETGRPTPAALDRPFPKFASPEHILIMVAGGTAGKFSAAVGGWATGGSGSEGGHAGHRAVDADLVLQVSGFKNLVAVDVRFGPFTCVVGPNGAGKSNLFDAIRFLNALANQTLMEAATSVRDQDSRTTDVRNLFHRVGDRYSRQDVFPGRNDRPQTKPSTTSGRKPPRASRSCATPSNWGTRLPVTT